MYAYNTDILKIRLLIYNFQRLDNKIGLDFYSLSFFFYDRFYLLLLFISFRAREINLNFFILRVSQLGFFFFYILFLS